MIGKGGRCSSRSARPCGPSCAEGAYLELVVKVDPDWQRQPKSLDRLGY